MKKIFTSILILNASLVTLHLQSQAVNGMIVSDTNNVTVVKLWGTSEERGFAAGYLLGDKGAIALEEWIIPWYGNDYELARALIEEGTTIKIDSVYREEAKAVIAGMDAAGFNSAGYDYLDVLAGTVWQDVGSNWPFSSKKAQMNCSAFMNWNDATAGTDLDGYSVLSHHLDWFFIPEHCFSSGSVIVHIPSEEGLQPWLMVDFAGYIAPGSCCNASGYCIATDGLNNPGWPDTNVSYTPYRFMIRKVLETNDYNLDGQYNMLDIREGIGEQEEGYITGSIFSCLGPSTAIHDSLIALIAEVAPTEPFITFRTNSYDDMMPGDNLYAANNPIARNNSHAYCQRYLAMVDTIGDGTNISSEANWEMMRLHSNGGNGNLVFMQFIPEWSRLKLSFCRKINDTIFPAWLVEPQIFDLEELFSIPVNIPNIEPKQTGMDFNMSPNPCNDHTVIDFKRSASSPCSIRIFNLTGQIIGEWNYPEIKGMTRITLNTGSYPPGLYFIMVKSNGFSTTKKLIVR